MGVKKRHKLLPPPPALGSARAVVLFTVLHTGHLTKFSLKQGFAAKFFFKMIWLKSEPPTSPGDHVI